MRHKALHPAAVIVVHQTFGVITRTFHPLPDRDRYRIASGLSVRRLPPVTITLLLIVWVTLSSD
jgi:hypothetical protein